MLVRCMPFSRFIAAFCLLLTAFYYFARLTTSPQPSLKITKSTFDWSAIQPFHPVPSPISLPPGKPQKLRRIQHDFGRQSRQTGRLQATRRNAVLSSFKRSWTSYRKYAWMKDELTPLSAGSRNTFGGWAATLIDSLDSLWIMGLKEEFHDAVEAAVTVDWANTTGTSCNLFETTIRYLGGLLSAHDLSKEPVLLEKAMELGDMLSVGFDTPNRMPPFWLDFEKAKTGQLVADMHEPSASAGSLCLEFTRLAQLTGEPRYYDAVARVTNLLHQQQHQTKLPGMWPMFFNMQDGNLTEGNTFSLGALSDSLYEYLPKMYALLGGVESVYREMYLPAAEVIKSHLLFRPMTPNNSDIMFAGTAHADLVTWREPEGQHLSCFTGGMFALGGRLFDQQEHVDIGVRLARGCAWAYSVFPTGLMPEIFNLVACESLSGCQWNETLWIHETRKGENWTTPLPKGFRNARDPKYILRPEAIESVFLLYRITGLEEFREAAWDMFQAIEKATSTPYGNAAINDVTTKDVPTQQDSMESFWLAETLKYFYLIFSPVDVMSLDDWVFNTEAHPFRIPKP